MGQKIYNEGRVVGLSAWEIFAKHAEAVGVPSTEIPNENQWLTAMIGAGASMILKIPAGTTADIHDFDLPLDSNLTSAGVIIANPFMGTCDWDDTNQWATKITSYSPLILNTTANYPSSSNVPQDNNYTTAVYKDCVSEFAKITDGVVFTKNATWVNSKIQEDDFTGDGETVTFALSSNAVSLDTITIDGAVPTTTYTLDTTNNTVTFGIAPADESEIIITYTSLPTKDINPNFNESSTTVRLYISSDITKDVAILLTGFQNKRILQGLSSFADNEGTGGSVDVINNDWANGGMLGPEVIPWASKIIFTVPSSTYKLANSLTRTIPSDEVIANPSYDASEKKLFGYTLQDFDNATVESNSFIDFNSITLTDYYDKHIEYLGSNTGIIEEDVQNVSLNTNALTAWYPGLTGEVINDLIDDSKYFPPALYASQVNTSGAVKLVPIDVSAPGTVKGFSNSTTAYNYKQLLPNNYSIYYNRNENTYSFVTPNEPDPNNWSGTAKIAYAADAPKATITVGNKQVGVVALTQSDASATPYDTSGSAGMLNPADPNNKMKPNRYFTWDNALNSLASGQKFDVLGDRLEKVGNELATNNTMGATYQVKSLTLTNSGGGQRVGTITSTAGASGDTVVAADCGIKSGTNYIEFPGNIRLYISKSAPTGNIPTGSIGIGW